ncbi:hypothetical protein, partial [Salmonella enterica]|uniref:hypothetical protein n=1 Tax=Salmonella enterica TaxID=28901 RepID=UPI0015915219
HGDTPRRVHGGRVEGDADRDGHRHRNRNHTRAGRRGQRRRSGQLLSKAARTGTTSVSIGSAVKKSVDTRFYHRSTSVLRTWIRTVS